MDITNSIKITICAFVLAINCTIECVGQTSYSDSLVFVEHKKSIFGKSRRTYSFREVTITNQQVCRVISDSKNTESIVLLKKSRRYMNLHTTAIIVGGGSAFISIIPISTRGYSVFGYDVANPTLEQKQKAKKTLRRGYFMLGSGLAIIGSSFYLKKQGKILWKKSIQSYNSQIPSKDKIGSMNIGYGETGLSLTFNF